MSKPDEPIKSETKAMCAVCAWRDDCRKKYNYDQFGPIKCADFTRDARLSDGRGARPSDSKEKQQ